MSISASYNQTLLYPQSDDSNSDWRDELQIGKASIEEELSEVFDQLSPADYEHIEAANLHRFCEKHSQLEPVTLSGLWAGLAQLATTGIVGTTEIVEAIHREIILRPLGRYKNYHVSQWEGDIFDKVYGLARWITQQVGRSVILPFFFYSKTFDNRQRRPLSPALKRMLNVINGILGDHLVTSENSLAVPMMLYNRFGKVQSVAPHKRQSTQSPSSSRLSFRRVKRQIAETINHHDQDLNKPLEGRVVILIHGLCMSYHSWKIMDVEGLGERIIQTQPDTTLLYLDYNTGQRIFDSGRNLAKLLQCLVNSNPDITQINLVGHSMGGLVARSGLFYAKRAGLRWVDRTTKLITLGTPHHGALLERMGATIQEIIAKVPFAGALSKIGNIRSVGIVDLRHGNIRKADWQSLEGRKILPDEFRHPTAVPTDMQTYFIAGTLIEGIHDSKVSALLGDGLVAVDSALGEHYGEQALYVPEGHKAVFYGIGHMDLVDHPRIHKQVLMWLADDGQSALNPKVHVYPDELNINM